MFSVKDKVKIDHFQIQKKGVLVAELAKPKGKKVMSVLLISLRFSMSNKNGTLTT